MSLISTFLTGATPRPHGPAFRWAVGIEDTFIPQPHPRTGRTLDEYELVGHYEQWRADLDLVATLDVDAVRYGIPWHRVNPAPGRFDWSWTDKVIPYLADGLGIAPILDLVHYGCPTWLTGEVLHPDYPQRVAEYAAAVAQRYAGMVRDWTPLNEPNVHATWCGRLGLWPPYGRGWSGFVAVLMAIARGMALTTAAIRSVDAEARIVMVEATEHALAGPGGEAAVAMTLERQFLPTDLLLGRVTRDHPSAAWLVAQGARDEDLAWLAEHPGSIDVMGVNFYPGWSLGRYAVSQRDATGEARRRRVYAEASHLEAVIRSWYRRYEVPVMVTETSDVGSVERRAAWLDASIAMVRRLRGEGFAMAGYTWFPALPHIGWDYRPGRRPIHAYRADMGLWDFGPSEDGRPYVETLLATRFREQVEAESEPR